MSVTFDSSILLNYYQAKSGVALTGGSAGSPAASKKVAPSAPWLSNTQTPAEASALVKAALSGRKIIDESSAQLDLPGASADYRKLFALYQGLSTLSSVAEQMNGKNLTDFDKSKISKAFAKGLAEVQAYVKDAAFDKLRLSPGEASTSAKAALTVARKQTDYVTDPLTSSSSDPVPAFQGDVKFNIAIKRINENFNIPIDLAGMGGQPRTLANVINYVNEQLEAVGVGTRFASQRLPGAERKLEVGGKTITLPATSDQWALKIKAGTSEAISFSAPATADAVYVAQMVGDPDPDGKPSTKDGVTQNQLLKFQTDTVDVPPPTQATGESYWVEGRLFAETMGPEVKAVRSTAVGPDGSVYVLADVTGKTSGQGIKGAQDVALMKYDSAGKLIYTRTLGAAETASGMALAVSADGKIAIAGSVTGVLNGATDGPLNSGSSSAFDDRSDSFVTLFNADGEELWTQRRGARLEDEATEIAFGADGAVYVAGRSKSVMPGASAIGDWDSYVQGFKADATGKVKTLFTESFGTAAADRPAGLVVDGNAMYTASIEDGRAVLRSFDLAGGKPVQTAIRDLGALNGGDIAGLAIDGGQLVVAGSTGNPALSGASASRAYSGGVDGFALKVSTSLVPTAGDRIAFYGGAGDDRVTSLAVSGGQVWLGGSAGTDLPDQAAVGKKDGFLTQIDIETGDIAWSRRFTGKDNQAAPVSIAVAQGGASVLDRLGLPSGELDLEGSQKLTAVSSLRAGDQFTVRIGSSTKTVTIEANDTLDTLATKLRRASGFQAKVTISTVSGARQLKIEPLNARTLIEIGAGKTDKDALEMLGIPEGVVRATTVNRAGKTVPADGNGMLYGLGIPSDLNLSSKEEINHVLAELATAMGVIRTAYKDLVAAASPKAATAAAAGPSNGKVPTYLSNQIANYQAALARLGG